MHNKPRAWPAVLAFVTAWLLPATSARRMVRTPLWAAWLVHVTAALLAVLLITLMVDWGNGRAAMYTFTEVIEELVKEYEREPLFFVAAAFMTVAGIELGFALLAAVLMAWGADDEPMRSSYANALRHLWLHTTHLLPVVLFVGTTAVLIDQAASRWRRANPWPSVVTWPEPPAEGMANAEAWQAYQRELQKASQANNEMWMAYRQGRPWYVHGTVIAHACFLSVFWFVWALLRAIGVRRDTLPVARAPTCETCGYNLSATPMDSRCPECGESVIDSLGPDARPGSPWQHREDLGRVRAWRRSATEAAFRPYRFGRRLRLTSPGTDHRAFIALHFVPCFFIAGSGMLTCFVVATGLNPFTAEPEVGWGAGPGIGCAAVLIAVLMPTLVAGLVGLRYRFLDQRNLMCGSMQAAAYLSGYLLLWTTLTTLLTVGIFALEQAHVWRSLSRTLNVAMQLLIMAGWLLPNFVCFGLYLWLIGRVTAGVRYANR